MLSVLILLILSAFTGCNPPPITEDNQGGTVQPPELTPVETEKDVLEAEAASLLKKMTLEEKVGQLLVVGFQEDIQEEALQEYFDRYKVSGFILFSRNYKDFDSLYTLVRTLKEKNSISNIVPLFISIDEEGGTVSRLPKGGTHFPEAKLIGKADNTELTYSSGEVIGRELKAAGINLDFAPVLDIVSDSGNKLLIKRSYGNNADVVTRHGMAFIDGLRSTGVIAAPKHFPGHGNTTVDSHSDLPVIAIDKELLDSRELVPFKSAIAAGTDIIMVGHIAFPKLDPSGLPATMSGYFLTDILREELGFEGIAISDDIEMSGYINAKASLEEGVVTSFNGGLDVFLIGHTKAIEMQIFEALKQAVLDGRITGERLDESVMRILRVKLRHKLTDTMDYSLEGASDIFGSDEHKEVLEDIKASIN